MAVKGGSPSTCSDFRESDFKRGRVGGKRNEKRKRKKLSLFVFFGGEKKKKKKESGIVKTLVDSLISF